MTYEYRVIVVVNEGDFEDDSLGYIQAIVEEGLRDAGLDAMVKPIEYQVAGNVHPTDIVGWENG